MEEHQRRAAMSDFLAPDDDVMPNDMTPDGIMSGMSTDEQHAIEYQNAAMQVYLCVCMCVCVYMCVCLCVIVFV